MLRLLCLAAPALLVAAAAPRRMSEEEPKGLAEFEMIQIISPIVVMIEHLNLEEFVMLLCTLFPITLGFFAFLESFTGIKKAPSSGGSGGDFDELTSSVHRDIEASSATLQSGMGSVEGKIAELQRAHDTRFADLHKDLAGIVWELSKLRADMARWQALAQLGARSASRVKQPGSPGAAAMGFAGASSQLPEPAPLPPSQRDD